MDLALIKKYLNNDVLDVTIYYHLEKLRIYYVSINSQERAKETWIYKKVYMIKTKYHEMFSLMKQGQFSQAWDILGYIKIDIANLKQHFNIERVEYLEFIDTTISQFKKLYPYHLFFSREGVIKGSKCSICGKGISLRTKCNHATGEIYDGKMRCEIITDYELIGGSLVENPEDHYGVPILTEPDNIVYNYERLEEVINYLDTPYESWTLNELRIKNKEYKKLGRNSLCLCGSKKKYKKCCLDTDNDSQLHYDIVFNEKNRVQVPFKIFPSSRTTKLI